MHTAIVIGDRWRLKTPAQLPHQWAATYGWCARCERVFPAVTWIENDWRCPTQTCEGTFDDAWAWGETTLAEHPEYPEEPDVGEKYLL